MAAPRTGLLPAALWLAAAGCASGRGAPPCVTGSCGAGSACVAGRCRAEGTLPASIDAARVVLLPKAIAVVSARGGGGGDALPEVVTIGRAADGRVVVLLQFDARFRDGAVVESAFLLIDPVDGAPPAGSAASIDVSRVLDPWDPATVSWGRQPRLAVAEIAGVSAAKPAPPRRLGPAATVGQPAGGAAAASLAAARAPLRVDVTELVRALPRGRGDHGFALTATGDDAFGTTLTTGLGRGRPPRLEVFLK